MNYKLDNAVLYLFIKGEINSTTSSEIEKDLEETIKDKNFSKLVLDFKEVTYVSSAGLRIILKLKQKYNDTSIQNVSLEVYDILQMTGFTNLMTIRKVLNTIDVSNATIIGDGYFSIVYRIDKDTIIKVFKEDCSIENVERELNLAKQAFILGIPTAISFDVVLVNNHYGVRFEMLDAVSLRDLFRDNNDKFDEYILKYANLVKKINTTITIDNHLPDTKLEWLKKLEFIKDKIDNNLYLKALKLLNSIEDRSTFVHGDCHIKNIMVQDNELLLIDMDTLSRGHPIFELAAVYAPYVAFEEDEKGNTERFFGISHELALKIYDGLLKNYLPIYSEENKEKIQIVSYLHMLWWNQINEPNNTVRFNGCLNRLLNLIDKYDDLNIGL